MMPNQNTEQDSKKPAPHGKDDYLKKIDAQMKEWDTQLAAFNAKATRGSSEGKAAYQHWYRGFAEKRAAAIKKVDTLRAAKTTAWEPMKAEVETLWTEVTSMFDSAKKKYA